MGEGRYGLRGEGGGGTGQGPVCVCLNDAAQKTHLCGGGLRLLVGRVEPRPRVAGALVPQLREGDAGDGAVAEGGAQELLELVRVLKRQE